MDPDYILGTDSSTAETIVNREGAGRLKHLDQMALWLQSERRDHGLHVVKVPVDQNPADLGTKSHSNMDFARVRDMCGIIKQPSWG